MTKLSPSFKVLAQLLYVFLWRLLRVKVKKYLGKMSLHALPKKGNIRKVA